MVSATNGSPRNVLVIVVSVFLVLSPLAEAKRSLGGGGRKTSSSGGGYSTRRQPQTSVTKPTYNTNSGNSHADQAKLSYPNYNSQPNRPASAPTQQNNQPMGWNVPGHSQAAGPPPAYSASNVAGGAKTNVHEPPPVYSKPNYAAPPPNYQQATGTQFGGAPTYHNPGQLPAGATYHSASNLPPGATYYNNPSHVPGGYAAGGSYPMHAGGGASYPMQGGYHPAAGGGYYPAAGAVPAGATYIPTGGALPPGAVLYSSPPQQTSSGLGFGSGLAAGAIGGAILGHVLTPSHTSVSAPAPAPAAADGSSGGGDRIIIINNSGQPVNATDVNGATVINTGAPAAPAAPGAAAAGDAPAPLAPMAPAAAGDAAAPLAPLAPMAPVAMQNTTSSEMPAAAPAAAMPNAEAQPPAPGGIICVPVRVNETDPNDASKTMEVEKIACYPAPPPPPPEAAAAPATMDAMNNGTMPAAMEGSAPLAPLQPVVQPVVGDSQQAEKANLVGEQEAKSANSATMQQQGLLGIITCFLVSYLVAY